MSVKSLKKRKTFVDLSDDDFDFEEVEREQKTVFKKLEPKKVIKTEPIHKKSVVQVVEEEKEKEPSFEPVIHEDKTPKVFEQPGIDKQEKNSSPEVKVEVSEPTESQNLVIKESFEILSEEPLNKGFHFYSNDRVMNKVKKCAKAKNIKLSKFITMILDKAIREE